MKRALFFGFILALSSIEASRADDESDHPLEAKVAALVDNANSTADMVQAYTKANKLWDAELNRCYGALKKKLPAAAFAELQAAQRKWIEYRDAQLKFIRVFYGGFEGTMYIPMANSAAMEITRKRALELYEALQMLEEDDG